MCKKKVYVLIWLSVALPTLLFAGALERYKVPQQSRYSTEPKASVNENVYTAFKNEISSYTDEQKIEAREYYRKKMKKAVDDKHLDAASYYRQLIGILNSELR